MEELSTTRFRFGVGLAYEDHKLRIHLIFPAPIVRLDFDMENFLLCLRDIKTTISLPVRDGELFVKHVGKDTCQLVFYNIRSTVARSVEICIDLGLLQYRDLLSAINMELNTLRLRGMREEVFKVPEWVKDGGFFR